MTDLTNLPAEITPEEFFTEALPEVLGEVDLPDGLGTERMQFNVVGDDGIEINIGIDEDGDLSLEYGQADSPPIAVTVTEEDFLSAIAGDLRDAIKDAVGDKMEIGPRQLRHTFMPDSVVQQIKALDGDVQIRIQDSDTGEDTVITVTLGGGTPNVDSPACTVKLGLSTLLDVAKGAKAEQLFMQGQIQIEGDMGIVLALMGIMGG